MTLLQEPFTNASNIATVGACILSLVCTVISFIVLQQNKKAIEASAYLTIRNDLAKDVFILASTHCKANFFNIDDTNSIQGVGYTITNGMMKLNQVLFVRDVLGNIEDLALFCESKILSINFIDSGYGYSILEIGNNLNVRSTIRLLRRSGCVYNGFNSLYCKIHSKLPYNEKDKYKCNILDL
jgi:hypothetical protein